MSLRLIFILADAAREENIGAAARALKVMGIHELRLVNPLCNHLGERARATAHASQEVLENAGVFASLSEAKQDIPLLIGTAAKKRNVREDYHPVDKLAEILLAKGHSIDKAGIVFGGEESGLSNTQLAECDLISTIPMLRKYPSLNLAQAVMVYATHLSKITLQHASASRLRPGQNELQVVKEKALQILQDVQLPADNIIHRRIMERLMSMHQDDINLFHSFAKFYLKKYHGRVK